MATSSSLHKRRKLWKVLVPLLVILLCVITGLLLIQRGTRSLEQNPNVVIRQVDQVLPDFKLSQLSGETTLISTFQAKVILINFWATWCDACMEEMPSIVHLRTDYKDRGFEAVGINVDENPEVVVPKARNAFQINFPIYADSEGRLSELFNVHAIPLTVIINHQRKILLIQDGGQNWNSPAIRSQLDRWLSQ